MKTTMSDSCNRRANTGKDNPSRAGRIAKAGIFTATPWRAAISAQSPVAWRAGRVTHTLFPARDRSGPRIV